MSYPQRANQFTSRLDALRRRKPVWYCLQCSLDTCGSKVCSNCGSKAEYFPSTGEFKAYRHRHMRMMAGEIANLQLHPRFDCVVNGIKVCRYTADWSYQEKGWTVVQEFKGSRAHASRDSTIRRKLAQALFGITIEVVEA